MATGRLFQGMAISLVLTTVYRTMNPGPCALPGPVTAWMGIALTLPSGIGVAGTGRQLAESRCLLVTPFVMVARLACASRLLHRRLSTPVCHHGHLMKIPVPPS